MCRPTCGTWSDVSFCFAAFLTLGRSPRGRGYLLFHGPHFREAPFMQSEIQFANRRAYPVHAEYGADGEWSSNGIAFDDYSRMQTSVRAVAPCRQLATPSWAVNDSQLRELLVAFLEERAFPQKAGLQTGTLPERLAKAQKKIIEASQKHLVPIIDRLCNRLVALKQGVTFTQDAQKQIRLLEQQIENVDTRLRYEARDGGAALTVGVVFFYFRCGQDSVAVGKQLGVKPPHVRQIVWRLRQTWARLEKWRLDPSTRPVPKLPKPVEPKPIRTPKPIEPKPERKPRTRGPQSKLSQLDVERGAILWSQGTAANAAKELGVSRSVLRKALKRAGLYQPRVKKIVVRKSSPKEIHIAIAEKLAKENGGKLPTCTWMCANGHLRTYEYMRGHRGFFAHIPRSKTNRGRPPVKPYSEDFNAARAVELYKAGYRIVDIAVALGAERSRGQNRVRRALIVAGVYRAQEKPGHGGPAVADCGADSAVVNGRLIQQDHLAVG